MPADSRATHGAADTPEATAAALAQTRLDNALWLFDEFVTLAAARPDPVALRGLERRFAEQLLIQPSYWSQIKSRTRQIGERLARQFEQRCKKPSGWMDQPRPPHGAGGPSPLALQLPLEPVAAPDLSSTPRDDDERFIVGLVLSYYRRHPQRARTRLLDLLGEVLSPPPAPPAPPSAAAAPPGADEAELFRQSQRGVAPLRPKRR